MRSYGVFKGLNCREERWTGLQHKIRVHPSGRRGKKCLLHGTVHDIPCILVVNFYRPFVNCLVFFLLMPWPGVPARGTLDYVKVEGLSCNCCLQGVPDTVPEFSRVVFSPIYGRVCENFNTLTAGVQLDWSIYNKTLRGVWYRCCSWPQNKYLTPHVQPWDRSEMFMRVMV